VLPFQEAHARWSLPRAYPNPFLNPVSP
jgi:hypothetical protein